MQAEFKQGEKIRIESTGPKRISEYEAWTSLSTAIVLQAIDEWRDLCRRGRSVSPKTVVPANPPYSIAELRMFFHSDWCDLLCGEVDVGILIQQMEAERIKSNERRKRPI